MLVEKENGNRVKIEGILSEIDLEHSSFQKNGIPTKAIRGTIKVRVKLPVKDQIHDLEIPVHMFATELTKTGKKNPAYENMEKIMNEYVSIAASSEEEADCIRITNGSLKMNEYYNSDVLVSFPRIHASFVSKIKRADMTPEASFSTIFVVGKAGPELDKEGVETGRYEIKGILPQYGGSVDVFTFYAESEGVINAVSSYWNESDTVRANGRLNFSSKTETRMTEVDFGDPVKQTYTVNISDLVLIGGSSTPLEGELGYDMQEIQNALTERQKTLAEKREKAKERGGAKGQAPSPNSQKGFNDLGF